MAANTASNEAKYMMFGSLNRRSHASWEYAPSTPWHATAGCSGNSCGVRAMACSISAVSGLVTPSSRFWQLRLSSKMSE